jgi:hypothetical protein
LNITFYFDFAENILRKFKVQHMNPRIYSLFPYCLQNQQMSGRSERLDGDRLEVRRRVHHQAGEGRRAGADGQIFEKTEKTERPRPHAVRHLRRQVQGRVRPLCPRRLQVHDQHAAATTAAAAVGQLCRRSRVDATAGSSGKLLSGFGVDAAVGRVHGDVASTSASGRGPVCVPGLLTSSDLSLFSGSDLRAASDGQRRATSHL